MITTKLVGKIVLRALKMFVGVFCSLVLLLVGSFYVTIPWHDFTLWRMEQSLTFSIQHPSSSHAIERKRFFGTRYTDTNECTYAVGEIRATKLSREELLHEYKNRSTGIFSFTPAEPIYTAIVEDDTPLPLDDPADAWIADFRAHIGQNTADTTYYVVYLYKPGKSWWGDFRCYE